MSLFVDFIPKYTKVEKILLQKIIRDFLGKKKTIYEIDELDLPKLKNDMDAFLDRFVKKGISYILHESRGTLLPISYYLINNDLIEFHLNPFLEDALLEKNDFKILNLKNTLLFQENFTKNFYYSFMIKNLEKREFIVTLDEFQNSLGFNEYERFYDFERNILKKIKYDIDSTTDYVLDFEKSKRNDFKNSKVTGLNFKLTDKNSEEKIKLANYLISLVSVKINDYKRLYDLIYNSLNNHLKTEIEIFIQKAASESKKQKKVFEDVLEQFLNKKSHYKLLTEFQGNFSNPIELEHMLSNVLKSIKKPNFLEREFASTQFLMKLYFSKEGEELNFQKDNLLITIRYSKKSATQIKIYETI